jgi:hypothetical protein
LFPHEGQTLASVSDQVWQEGHFLETGIVS